jgi:hypothetical protein
MKPIPMQAKSWIGLKQVNDLQLFWCLIKSNGGLAITMGKNNLKLIFPAISETDQWMRIDDEVDLYFRNYSEFGFLRHDIKSLNKEAQNLILRSLLESRCIHARNLCEIFTLEINWGTDITIAKLDKSWADDNQELICNLRHAYNPAGSDLNPKAMLDKFLFHPTLNRKFVLDFEVPLKHIHIPLTSIISALPPDKAPSRSKHTIDFPNFAPYIEHPPK